MDSSHYRRHMSTDNNPKQSPEGDNNSCGFFITQGSPLFVDGLERSVFPLTRFLGPEEQPLSEHRRGGATDYGEDIRHG